MADAIVLTSVVSTSEVCLINFVTSGETASNDAQYSSVCILVNVTAAHQVVLRG
jgi:hypothetical protein